jgi:hypothetical protein
MLRVSASAAEKKTTTPADLEKYPEDKKGTNAVHYDASSLHAS